MAKNTGRGTRSALSEPRGADGRPIFYNGKMRGGAFGRKPSRWSAIGRGLWRGVKFGLGCRHP